MTDRASYKKTLIDRLGPDSADVMKAVAYGTVAATVSFVFLFVIGLEILHLRFVQTILLRWVGRSASEGSSQSSRY
jgi:1,4-dihydroxy-2-naphthoate octaprenyltransferase